MKTVGIVGSGPAALMAAEVVSATGTSVSLFEKRKGLGRKLLIAGSSGLNITNSLPLDEFTRHYSGGPADFWKRVIGGFTPKDWIGFIEKDLGIPTFEGTSGRYFVENMKASLLLQAWKKRLSDRGVEFHLGTECVGFKESGRQIELELADGTKRSFDAVCFALGGGSYEDAPVRWPEMFQMRGLKFREFTPSNVGYTVAWKEGFLKEAEGLPLKRILLTSPRGSRQGEMVVTKYGLEGTPVYFVGKKGWVVLDLKPDLSAAEILKKLSSVKENLSPLRRIKKVLNLDDAALALLFHHGPPEVLKSTDLPKVVGMVKEFRLELGDPRPLAEAISSGGGLDLAEIGPDFMLRKIPGVFAAGEMLDWDVPTGGFLIQGCVAMGRAAGQGILDYLRG